MIDKDSEHIIDKLSRLIQTSGEILFWYFIAFLFFVVVMTGVIISYR